ncbi:hypothetical protein LC1981_0379 [Lacticaseibacillus paracasei NRIC 1981]|uniref:hypothetical protein n=1 Tax=Lacticaseibacillus paracasei TaxID=1597 RepID=UPI0005E5BB2A|nr:hypothetical protein [Lacticaseibacillus paracasei]GAN41160.1 hypothetical protein LC1981_0379 [Lacticaseibacillus paracasei NRIC 1981]
MEYFLTQLKTVWSWISPIITILTFLLSIRASKKVQFAVDRESLKENQTMILGVLDAYVSKLETYDDVAEKGYVKTIKLIRMDVQKWYIKYYVLHTWQTRIFLHRLNTKPNRKPEEVRKDLLRLGRLVKRMV